MGRYENRNHFLPPDARIIPPLQQPQRYTSAMDVPLPSARTISSANAHGRDSFSISLARELFSIIVPALIIAVLIQIFLAQATQVVGYSMEPTLHGHERLIIEKVSYHFDIPERGDIVVIRVDGFDELLIKRVIGLPGDSLRVDNGIVSINGVTLSEPYVNGTPLGNYPVIKIPDGYIFVMGDNRNNSNDSRSFGPVAIENVVGHAWMRYWPLHDFQLITQDHKLWR